MSKTDHRAWAISLAGDVIFYVLFIPFLIWTFVANCSELQALGAERMTDNTRPVLAISQPGHYLSIQELENFCRIPGTCGQNMACEGQEALVKAFIDYDNVFHKGVYPKLPYEKFRIYDQPAGPSLEVWATAKDNSLIFEKILQAKKHPEERAHVRGVVVGFDMHTQKLCRRGIKMVISDAESIFFK
jgi:hypothetical protein